MSEVRDAVSVVDGLLGDGYHVRLRVTGRSMIPWLRDGEVVTLRPLGRGGARIGDLLLFRARSGHLVLHRLVGSHRTEDGTRRYVLKGDAAAFPDEPVSGGQILGKVAAVSRVSRSGGDREVPMETAARRAGHFLIACTSRWAPRLSASVSRRVFSLATGRAPACASGGRGAVR